MAALVAPFVLGGSQASPRVTAAVAAAATRTQAATLLPGGLQTIVRAGVPNGPSFAIVGERYEFLGHVRFTLQIDIEHSGVGEPVRGRHQRLIGWYFWASCRPHEYAVLYALLRAPRDTVLAQTAERTMPLRHVRIPRGLHAAGVLVYAVLPSLPSKLIVRTPGEQTALAESLGPLPRENTETCEAQP
jgi:hypothetical protein